MQFEFSNINTQYNMNAELIASVAKENANATKSNLSSLNNLNLDAAVLSISDEGTAKINAMMSKSIQIKSKIANGDLSISDRQEASIELAELHKEIGEICNEEDADKMLEESKNNILKNADDSLKTLTSNRESVLQLL